MKESVEMTFQDWAEYYHQMKKLSRAFGIHGAKKEAARELNQSNCVISSTLNGRSVNPELLKKLEEFSYRNPKLYKRQCDELKLRYSEHRGLQMEAAKALKRPNGLVSEVLSGVKLRPDVLRELQGFIETSVS